MRIAVIGAGGVGGYFGGILARAGHDVALLARGAHLKALKDNGLSVSSIGGDFVVPSIVATDDAAEVGVVDVVLIAVKSFQLVGAARTAAPLIGEHTLVVPLQNGVDAYETLASVIDPRNVGKGLTRIISRLAGPGRIEHFGVPTPYVAVTEGDGSSSDRVEALVEALAAAGVEAEVPADIDQALWQKFLFVCSFGSVAAACRATIGVVRSHESSRAMLSGAMHEIRTLASARGVEFDEAVVDRTLAFIDSLHPDGTASLQRDIAKGRPSELDAWTGTVVRLGRDSGVPTPIHAFILAALSPGEAEARREPEEQAPGVAGDREAASETASEVTTETSGTVAPEAVAVHADERGVVIEPVDAADLVGQANVHAVLTRPGFIRGNHRHRKGHEVMTVVGPATVRYRGDGEPAEVQIPAGEAVRFRFPPGVAHAVQNTGDELGLLVAFNTEGHDPDNPDVVRDVLI